MFKTELDLRAYRPNEWVLLAPLEWKSKDALITVPRGFITDLASVPRPLRGLLNVNGASRAPAVLHDFCYCSQWRRSREVSDALFLEGLVACGVSEFAQRLYHAGVRVGGWRYWNKRRASQGLQSHDFVPSDYFT